MTPGPFPPDLPREHAHHVPWRWEFATRLALPSSLLIIVACLSLSWIIVNQHLAQIRETLAARGRALAEHLARDAELGVLSGDGESLRRLASSTRLETDVVYSKVLDETGRLLASAGELPTGIYPSPAPSPGAASMTPPTEERQWEFQAPVLTATTRPQREELEFLGESPPNAAAAQRRIGTAIIGVSLAPLYARRHQVLVTATGFTVLVAFIAVLSAIALSKAITRPLHSLVHAAEAIARGNLNTSVPVETHDEIGALAESFNVMAQSLAYNRAALETQNHTLEAKVFARTKRLEELNRQLREADRLKSEFLATVSHELRTPLNVIIGYAEMLLDEAGGSVSNDQFGMIEAIRRYSKQQLDLVTNVLDFSRLASGKVSVHVEQFSLYPVLTDIVAPHLASLGQRGIRLDLEVPSELPELETDRVKLQEIIRNLVDNAEKFTATGDITIAAGHDPKRDHIIIDVSDTGPGIPAGALSRVFEPFLQVGESSTRSTSGVGLGLSIVKQLADVLGGRVSIWSQVGEGSTFRVDLPRRLAASGDEANAQPPQPPRQEGPSPTATTHTANQPFAAAPAA